MRTKYFITSICILFAFYLPSSLARTHEGGVAKPTTTQAQPLEPPKLEKVGYLSTIEPTPVVQPVRGCGDNQYANYIYMHESGCRTDAVNSIGCYGIGQNCGSAVRTECGADYACQNSWFTNYANTHCDYHLGYPICYKGWAGAYNFWLAYHYW